MRTDRLLLSTQPMARFDGLVLDTAEPARAAAFWSIALGRSIVRPHRVCAIAADGRVHLDLGSPGAGPEPLLAAGARPLHPPAADARCEFADPEGNRFRTDPHLPYGVFRLVVECPRPRRVARWWAEVIGGRATDDGGSTTVGTLSGFPGSSLRFSPAPPGSGPAHGHFSWHLVTQGREFAALVAAGARMMSRPAEPHGSWLLADPDGNRFRVTDASADRYIG
ncbi:VOC family protein [Actinoplanes sp. G11-F43]|uniref:VOC family protein n=1 Tax=Actinoplanes sp. G11-F43 TaxID=3424130 RepID=UPI003D3584AD